MTDALQPAARTLKPRRWSNARATPPAPRPSLADTLHFPVIAYCTDPARAVELIREVIRDGHGAPIALDTETTPLPSEVERIKEAKLREAALKGEIKAARKAKAPEGEIAELEAKLKIIKKRVEYLGTAGLDVTRSQLRLVQLFAGGPRVVVLDIFRTGTDVLRHLENTDVVIHNSKFDLPFFEEIGIALGAVHCSAQMAACTLGVWSTGLDDAAKAHLGVELDKDSQTSDWSASPLSRRQIEYAAVDVVVGWRLAQRIFPALGPQMPAYEIAASAVPAFSRMQRRGIKIDQTAHAEFVRSLEAERAEACEAYKAECLNTGWANFAESLPKTPNQVRALLSAVLAPSQLASWPLSKKTKLLSVARADLRRAAERFKPIVALSNVMRIDKMLTCFGPTLPALINPITGCIHANYRVAGAASGRTTCSGPNFQQMPSGKSDKRFRTFIVAGEGKVFVAGDFSLMEMRAAAYKAADAQMIAAFRNGIDLHALTASRMLRKPIEEVSSEERSNAKPINFGAIYGEGVPGLVKSIWKTQGRDMSEVEAREWLDVFANTYPNFAKKWRREHYLRCKAAGHIVIGRDADRGVGRIVPLSRIPPDRSDYTESCNYPIQGACADAAMRAITAIDDMLFEAGIDGGPVAFIHDELILEVAKADASRAAELLEKAMNDAFEETFPGSRELGLLNGLVEAKIGADWASVK